MGPFKKYKKTAKYLHCIKQFGKSPKVYRVKYQKCSFNNVCNIFGTFSYLISQIWGSKSKKKLLSNKLKNEKKMEKEEKKEIDMVIQI